MFSVSRKALRDSNNGMRCRENYVKVNGGEKVYSFTSPLIYLFALKFEYGDELLKQRVSCEIYSLLYFAGSTEKSTDHVIYL